MVHKIGQNVKVSHWSHMDSLTLHVYFFLISSKRSGPVAKLGFFLEENQGSLDVHSVQLTVLLLPYELTFFPLFVK